MGNGERDSARGWKLCQEVYGFKFDIQPMVAMNPASSLAQTWGRTFAKVRARVTISATVPTTNRGDFLLVIFCLSEAAS
jgi:hypothetical protein